MTSEQAQRLTELTARLSEHLMSAAICADELRNVLGAAPDGHAIHRGRSKHANPARHRPLVDESTLSVRWNGHTCPLGHTILFRLAARLARQPNQYITADQLLSDVWDGGVKSPGTIRSAVRHLRERLSSAGMGDIAAAIQGTDGRYGLILDGAT